MAGRILVGSCSWADKTLIDSGWYPPSAKSPAERLRFYADQFAIVEADSPYYAIPLPQVAESWVERTPPDFVFDVKSYALFTGHGAQVASLPKDVREALPAEQQAKKNVYLKDLPPEMSDEMWRRWNDVLLPLDSAGKLGIVLFQFPPWFGPSHANREHILEAKGRLRQYTMAVEFRNGTWMREPPDQERTLRFLSEQAIPYVCVDEPQGFKSSVPPVTAATAPVALLRMHGHNAATWEGRSATAAERFDYLYTEDELRDWVPAIRRLADEAREVHVLMNNCHRDYSVRNARQIGEMLGVVGRAQSRVQSEEREGEQGELL
ncbi:MAG TPA: DUF72 domain-containing protein [Dehalococcoidia bacterium]|nr:DUF72 domain-containing protein [Dehalococcoidia bacterium]